RRQAGRAEGGGGPPHDAGRAGPGGAGGGHHGRGRGRCQPAGGRQLGLATVRPLRCCTAVVVAAGLAVTVAASGCGSVTPSIAAGFPKWFQDRVLGRNARAVAVRAALSGLDFSDDSLRQYFEAHKGEFGGNCVAHILVKTKPEADAALARLKGGEDFAAVA